MFRVLENKGKLFEKNEDYLKFYQNEEESIREEILEKRIKNLFCYYVWKYLTRKIVSVLIIKYRWRYFETKCSTDEERKFFKILALEELHRENVQKITLPHKYWISNFCLMKIGISKVEKWSITNKRKQKKINS